MKFFKCVVSKKGLKSKEFKEIKKCVEYTKTKSKADCYKPSDCYKPKTDCYKPSDCYKPVNCYPTNGEVA